MASEKISSEDRTSHGAEARCAGCMTHPFAMEEEQVGKSQELAVRELR